jgi:transposase
MSKHLIVANHLTELELRARAEAAEDPIERMSWVAILQKKAGKAATLIADFCNRQPDWVRRVVRAYNELGPESVTDGRIRNGAKGRFTADLQAELQAALEHESPPGGALWNGPKVARWVSKRTGDIVHPRTGWAYLKKLNWSIKVPLPTHPDSDEGAKEAFKKGG